MGKVEELTKLIETKHIEWKKLSINSLRDASGYKRWVAETVLKEYRSDSDQIDNKTKNKVPKSNNKASTKTTGGQHSTLPPNLLTMSPEQMLILGMTKQIELDPTLFRTYIKLGYFDRDQQKRTQSYQYYKRPEWFTKIQEQLIQIYRSGSCLIVGARQKTFKTSTEHYHYDGLSNKASEQIVLYKS